MRLKAMAQVRAQTIAAKIRRKILEPGQPRVARAATIIEASAKGSAKIVCDNFTKLENFLIWENIECPCSTTEHHALIRSRRGDAVHSKSENGPSENESKKNSFAHQEQRNFQVRLIFI